MQALLEVPALILTIELSKSYRIKRKRIIEPSIYRWFFLLFHFFTTLTAENGAIHIVMLTILTDIVLFIFLPF
jgi:hypothetical protein